MTRNILMIGFEYRAPPAFKNRVWYSGGRGEVITEVSERLPNINGYEVFSFPLSKDDNFLHFSYKPNIHVVGIPVKKFRAGEYRGPKFQEYPTQEGYDALDYAYGVADVITKSNGFGDHLLNGFSLPVFDGHDSIVHTHDWQTSESGIELKEKLGIPMIHSRHESVPAVGEGKLKFDKRACEHADLVHVPSKWQSENVVNGYQIPRSKVIIIPNGVNSGKFVPCPEDEIGTCKDTIAKYGLAYEGYFLTTGRASHAKNFEMVIEGYNKYRERNRSSDVKLGMFLAPGEATDRIKQVLTDLNPNVRKDIVFYEGYLLSEDRQRLYQGSLASIFISLIETFGIVSLESQACGRPVVVSKNTGLEETVINGRTGEVVDPFDADSIAQGYEDVLQDRIQKGREARHWVKEFFDWDLIVPMYHDLLYSKLL